MLPQPQRRSSGHRNLNQNFSPQIKFISTIADRNNSTVAAHKSFQSANLACLTASLVYHFATTPKHTLDKRRKTRWEKRMWRWQIIIVVAFSLLFGFALWFIGKMTQFR